MDTDAINTMDVYARGHEQIVIRQDTRSDLRAVIAIHSTVMGPALGGCRHWTYGNAADAVEDALRLSEGMTFKNALADIPFGGGKAVISGVRGRPLSARQLETFGRWVEELGGRYVTAEDVGMHVADMRIIGRATRYVSGLGTSGVGGDPSPRTAEGVLAGLRAAVRFRLGTDSLDGLRVAVQGLGNVGFHLASLLSHAGARVWVADIDEDRLNRAVKALGATALPVDEVLTAEVDVVAPCALGGILDARTVEGLRAAVVAGAANNQLADDRVGEMLTERGILYAPDYVINAGGVISIAQEYLGVRDPEWTESRISAIAGRLESLFQRARETGEPTGRLADRMAQEKLAAVAREELQGVA